jgi:tellurite resistance protein TerB
VIACADGELAEAEVERFVQTVINAKTLPRVAPERLEAMFRDVCQAIFTDVADGRARALEAIAQVKGDAQRVDLVVRAAQVAVVADEKLRKAEERALAQICETLGLDPKGH